MKKLIICISLLILCLTISSCGLKESVVEGLSQKMYNEITEAYVEYQKDNSNRIINMENVQIKAYFGKYNDYYIVLIDELDIGCPDVYTEPVKTGDSYFDFSCGEYIYAYYNNKLYILWTPYKEGFLSEEDIEEISNKFDEYRINKRK